MKRSDFQTPPSVSGTHCACRLPSELPVRGRRQVDPVVRHVLRRALAHVGQVDQVGAVQRASGLTADALIHLSPRDVGQTSDSVLAAAKPSHDGGLEWRERCQSQRGHDAVGTGELAGDVVQALQADPDRVDVVFPQIVGPADDQDAIIRRLSRSQLVAQPSGHCVNRLHDDAARRDRRLRPEPL
eukprot:5820429-Prymnesium_polylepis.1